MSSNPHHGTVGAIERFMTGDHTDIDRSLAASERDDGAIDEDAYSAFRQAILRHIAMEEKVLLPFIREKRGREGFPAASALRADHGKIAKLLVPTPTATILASLHELLGRHNALEEGPAGLYATCDQLSDDAESRALIERLRAQPQVPLAKYYDGPLHRPR